MKYIEEWRTAVYDGEKYERFQVSNLGRVMNLNYRGTGKSKLTKLSHNGHGYLVVELRKDGETKTCLVHRLVAQTFLPNPDNLPEINHIDEDKTNNRIDNIEWKSHKDNINHGTRNERVSKAEINDPNKSKRVLQLTLDGDLIREWPSASEVGRNGFNKGHVAACCRGEEKTHKGFKWMFADDYKESQLKHLGYIPLF